MDGVPLGSSDGELLGLLEGTTDGSELNDGESLGSYSIERRFDTVGEDVGDDDGADDESIDGPALGSTLCIDDGPCDG